MFKVGHKIEILNPEEMGLEDEYKENSIFTVSEVGEDGDAVDKEGWYVHKEWVEDCYARILPEEPKPTPRDLACFDQVANIIGEDKAEQELGVVVDGGFYDDEDRLKKALLIRAFCWGKTPQGGRFWSYIYDGFNPYKESRIDVIGQNGNDGEHYAEVDGKKTMLQDKEFLENYDKHQAAVKAMDEVHTSENKKFSDLEEDEQDLLVRLINNYGYPPEGTTHFDMRDDAISSWTKVESDSMYCWKKTGWYKYSDRVSSVDYVKLPDAPFYNPDDVAFKAKTKTPAHAFLEAGVKHLKDRASERDTSEERSMKSCVNAFNAMYADTIKANNGRLTEELGWMFMVFLKASRAKGGDYRQDDYEDGAAYFALAGETASIERKNAKQNK